jgi:fluoride ion exporter CrcB/FEX
MLETRSLAEDRQWRAAAANIAVSVALGLVAAAAGHWLGVATR